MRHVISNPEIETKSYAGGTWYLVPSDCSRYQADLEVIGTYQMLVIEH